MNHDALAQQQLQALSTLFAQGSYKELESAARELLAREPGQGFAWKALGVSLSAQGRSAEALEAKRKAAELLPDDAEAHHNLGNAFASQGDAGKAGACFRRALALAPDWAGAWITLGDLLCAQGELREAEACRRRVVALQPDSAQAHNSLGNLLRDTGQMPEAESSYRKALALKPDMSEALSNLGNTLADLGRPVEAEARYRQALVLAPSRAEIHSNLGNLLKDQGRLKEAQACYRAALALKPDFAGAHSNLLLAMNYDLELGAPECLAEALRFGERVTRAAGAVLAARGAPRQPGPLRVGFVSGDLRLHPVGHFLEAVLAAVDPARLTLIAYPTLLREDELTARIKPRFAGWRSLFGLSDEAAARRIHADKVDVLVDLSGHTAYNRLGVFAWRPAPVQASWLGYFATTGVPAIDWVLADPVSVPPASEGQFSERIWSLPRTRLCFTAPAHAPAVAPLPALAGKGVTFGCFQNLGKLSDETLRMWSRVLAAVPGSRLRMQNGQLGDAALRERMKARLEQFGISPSRVAMHGKTSRQKYLAAHSVVDIVLDTFPYPGGTTTCEALWMGVPTVTLAGDRMLSRQGASLLGAAGLADWIAADEDDFVRKAASFAGDLGALARLRSGMRQHLASCPLFDAASFAAHLQQALEAMAAEAAATNQPNPAP